MKKVHFRIIELPTHQVLLQKDFDNESDDDTYLIIISFFVDNAKATHKYTYEKEIVFYAHYKKLVYHSTECIYSPNAYRGHVRELIKDLEAQRPAAIIDIIHSAEKMKLDESVKEGNLTNKVKAQQKFDCIYCGFMTSNKVCKACLLLDKLKKLKSKQIIEFELGEDKADNSVLEPKVIEKDNKKIIKIDI